MHNFFFQGGEVLVQCHVTGTERVEGIRLTTSKGRQMIIGKNGPDAQPLISKLNPKGIVGFYDTWAERGTPQATLVSFGVFTWGSRLHASDFTEDDPHGYRWCPSCPPPWTFRPRNRSYLWDDHNQPKGKPSSSFGPNFICQPNDTTGVNGHPWCHCAHGGLAAGELEKSQHYTTETWEVGRSRLATLRLWIGDGGALTGLQYVADNDRTSPFWGSSRMGCPVEVDLPFKSGTGAALKFFLDSDERNEKGVDFVVVAVQVLSIELEKEDELEPWSKELIASLGPRWLKNKYRV